MMNVTIWVIAVGVVVTIVLAWMLHQAKNTVVATVVDAQEEVNAAIQEGIESQLVTYANYTAARAEESGADVDIKEAAAAKEALQEYRANIE